VLLRYVSSAHKAVPNVNVRVLAAPVKTVCRDSAEDSCVTSSSAQINTSSDTVL
jgi:hypothetical protein